MPELDAWAEVVVQLLRPGGVLYLIEIHPIVLGVLGDGRTFTQDILDSRYIRWDEKGGTYAAPDAVFANSVTCERVHSVSEVVTSVLGAGLTLELLHEQSMTNAPWPWTVRGVDGFYRLPDGWPKYPLTYSLPARRPTWNVG